MELALGPGAVVTTVVDASRFPQLAASYGVRSVPLTVLDGGQSFVGVVEAEVILQALAQRDSDDYEGTLFQSLLDSGRHAEAAQRLIGGTARSWWLEAWRESAMSQRIGLLLVAEEALALEASVLDGLLPELQTLAVQAADPSLRGDTADLLGKIGHPAARPALVQACNDENAEVAEVAREALEELDESTRTTNGSGRG
jgi:thioredoxin-like negative regulator of GroEL